MKHLIIKILLFLYCIIPAVILHAQSERKIIYLVDASAITSKSDNLWKNTRKWLENDIRSLREGCVSIIPFQEETCPPITFDVIDFADNQADMVVAKIDGEVKRLKRSNAKANLYNALKDAVKHIDNKKDNFIYILCNSVGDEQDMAAVSLFMRNWCTMKPDNVQVFYIMLTRNAYDESLVKAINNCPDIHLIRAKGQKMKPVCAFMPREIVVNLQDMQDESRSSWPFGMMSKQRIHFSVDGQFSFSLSTTDTLFQVQNRLRVANAYGSVKVMPKSSTTIEESLSGINEYHFDIQVKADTHEVWLVTDSIHVRVVNKPERILYLPPTWNFEFHAQHYPQFLFWKANRPDTLHIRLEDFMNREARQNNATAFFQMSFDDIQDADFQLFFNGVERIDKTFTLDSNAMTNRLDIVFSGKVRAGTHQLVMRCLSSDRLDRINALAPEKLYQSQLVDYQYIQNPLAYLLVVFCLLLIAIPPSICLISQKFSK